MDFGFTPEQEALRREAEEFFQEAMKEAPPGWLGGVDGAFSSDAGWAFHRQLARKLAAKGWLFCSWPKEYGGQGAPAMEEMILNEVAGYHRAPGVDIFANMLGPTILVVGTEEQKREFLPPMTRAEVMWCEGWSEPNAGSDLAALTTRAVRDGDYYIVNGQKIWTTGAHRADWIFLLVRTDPTARKHRGLTFLLADMKTPGITVRPIEFMNGTHSFNEVFFDDVKVPVKNRLGEENRGWEVTRILMNFERSNVGEVAQVKRDLEELVAFCKEPGPRGKVPLDDPVVRHDLSSIAVEVEVGRAMAYRIAWLKEKGEVQASTALASAAKVFGSELAQRLAYTGSRVMGLYGQVKAGSPWAPLYGRFEQSYQLCIGMNIAAGSSEIQRNLIAWTALGLPRV